MEKDHGGGGGLTSNLVKSLTSVHLPPPPGSSSSCSRILSTLDNNTVNAAPSPVKKDKITPAAAMVENYKPQVGELLAHEQQQQQPYEDDGSKPQISYANLIGMAILKSEKKRLTLSQIYKWIGDSYRYYQTCDSGWQNSIRHNLSLNKAFVKQERSKDEPGKGNYWAIQSGFESQFIKAFKQTIKRSKSSTVAKRSQTTTTTPSSSSSLRGQESIIDMSPSIAVRCQTLPPSIKPSPGKIFIKPEVLGTSTSEAVKTDSSSTVVDDDDDDGNDNSRAKNDGIVIKRERSSSVDECSSNKKPGATSIFNASCHNLLNEHELLPDYASLKEENWWSPGTPHETPISNHKTGGLVRKRRLLTSRDYYTFDSLSSPESAVKPHSSAARRITPRRSSLDKHMSPPSWLKQLSTPNLTFGGSSSSPSRNGLPCTPYHHHHHQQQQLGKSISPTTCLRNHRTMIRNLTSPDDNTHSPGRVAKLLIYNNNKDEEEGDDDDEEDDDPISRACFGSPDKRAAKRQKQLLYLDSDYVYSKEQITDVFGVDICQVMRRAVNSNSISDDPVQPASPSSVMVNSVCEVIIDDQS